MSLNDINILTKRLWLRGISLSDAEAVFKYRSDPKVYKFQGLRPKTVEDIYEFINKTAKAPNIPDTWYQLVIVIKETNEVIGDVGIHFCDLDNYHVEIGYTLASQYQGNGYATEAVIGVINYLFRDLNKHRITASVDPENTRSIALLERIGMRKEAHFKKSILWNNEWTDDVIYGILEEEWFVNNKGN